MKLFAGAKRGRVRLIFLKLRPSRKQGSLLGNQAEELMGGGLANMDLILAGDAELGGVDGGPVRAGGIVGLLGRET